MKFTKLNMMALILLSLICLTSFIQTKSNNLLSKNKRLSKNKNKIDPPADINENVFPLDYKNQLSEKTRDLAQNQTLIARKLLYSPNNFVKVEMINAAKVLLKFIQSFATSADTEIFEAMEFNRGINGGVMDGKNKGEQEKMVKAVIAGTGSGSENAGFMALMGDIGTAIMDYEDPPKKAEDKKKNGNI